MSKTPKPIKFDINLCITKFNQIEKNLNQLQLKLFTNDFVFKTFINELACQKNLLLKLQTNMENNKIHYVGQVNKLLKLINKLDTQIHEINDANKYCYKIISDVDDIILMFKIDNDFYKQFDSNIYTSVNLQQKINEKKSALLDIHKKCNNISSNIKILKSFTFMSDKFFEITNTYINNFKAEFKFSYSLLDKIMDIRKEIAHEEFVKKSQTFSNLSANELAAISSQLWMPNKVFGKTDKTKSDYKLSSSVCKKVKSDSWFKIKKLTNVIHYIPKLSENSSDKIIFQYKELIGWNNNFCIECNIYKKYKSIEFIEKLNVEHTNKQKMETINEKELEIKDMKQKFNPLTKSNKTKKTKKIVDFDELKKPCKFVVTTTNNKIVYGRHCGNLCEDKLDTCKNHTNNKTENIEFIFADNLCQHIITQKSIGRGSNIISDRKGMKCNEFTFSSINKKYCSVHSKSHELEELINKETDLRSFKIRIYPTTKQYISGEKCFGSARKTYNMCVENDVYSKMTEDEARKKYVIDIFKLGKEYEFLKEIPKEIREFEVSEYYKNKKNALEMYDRSLKNEEWKRENLRNIKKNEIKIPEFEYKMKCDDQSINISKSTVNVKDNKISFYKGLFGGEIKIRNRLLKKDERLKKIFKTGINHDMKLIKNKLGKYYLSICVDTEIKEEKQETKVVGIDVGARTPYVTYSEEECYEYGEEMKNELKKMIEKRESLRRIYGAEIRKKQTGKGNEEQYERSKKTYLKYVDKIKNRIEDFHNKVIAKLVKEYSIILIPKLNVKKIMESEKTHKTTKKMFSILRHSQFMKKIINKCKIEGVILRIVNEDMTTQTCGNCFANYKFSEEIYECKKCGLIIGRDINSARNIYIKEIGKILEFIKYIRSI